jgi:hypothetical protein
MKQAECHLFRQTTWTKMNLYLQFPDPFAFIAIDSSLKDRKIGDFPAKQRSCL